MQVSGFRIYFLEPGYFFSIILSEFLKNRVALQRNQMNNNIKYLNPLKPMTAAGVGCTRLELWLVDLPKPDNETHVQYGVRPAIVISNNKANENSPAITVIPLTSNRKKG